MQFRIHSSTHTTILLHVQSTPIIEHSSSLYIGAFPTHIDLSGKESVSKHDQVQDFDWVRGGKSPNWTALGSTASGMVFTPTDSEAIRALKDGNEVGEIVDRLTSSQSHAVADKV